MTKIGYCIYNTSMLDYTVNLYEHTINANNDYFVFHSDSLTKDRSNSTKEVRQAIDISYSSVKTIITRIKAEKIDVFIFFTFQSEADSLILKICKLLGIFTILHDHGVVYGNNIAKGGRRLNKHTIKRKFFFKANSLQLFLITKINFKFTNYTNIKKTTFDYYLFYSNNNLNYYKNFFELDFKNYAIGGVPLMIDKIEKTKLLKLKKQNYALYIYQPFKKFKFSDLSESEEIDYILSINKILKEKNFKLEIRLHPTQSIATYSKLLTDDNITFDTNTPLKVQAAKSKLIIGHWSTALSISKPLNVPLFILNFPKIKESFLHYYDIFKKLGIFCQSLSDFKSQLSSDHTLQECNYSNDEKWINLIGVVNTHENLSIILKDILRKQIKTHD